MNWNVPWNLQWNNYPPSVFPTTSFPGHVTGLSPSLFNTFPLQPPVFSPGVNGIHQNLPHPPITVAQTPQQASSVAPPRGFNIGGGGTAQAGTSPLAPRQEDSVPSSSLVCSETYNFIVVLLYVMS